MSRDELLKFVEESVQRWAKFANRWQWIQKETFKFVLRYVPSEPGNSSWDHSTWVLKPDHEKGVCKWEVRPCLPASMVQPKPQLWGKNAGGFVWQPIAPILYPDVETTLSHEGLQEWYAKQVGGALEQVREFYGYSHEKAKEGVYDGEKSFLEAGLNNGQKED
jgi:hypothetical protein